MTELNTPQYIGSRPFKSTLTSSNSNACSKTVCKILVPVLIAVGVAIAIFVVIKLMKGKSTSAPTSPPPSIQSQNQNQNQMRAYPRNVPTYPVNNGTTQDSVQQMLDKRYVNAQPLPYNDNKMAAYQSYAETVAANGTAETWDEAAFNKIVLQQHKPAVIAFTSDGCGHCQVLKPKFMEAAKHAKIGMAFVDARGAGSLLQKYGIRGFPTIVLFRGGERVKDYSGDRSVQSLVAFADGN